jgi:hypothetical protein
MVLLREKSLANRDLPGEGMNLEKLGKDGADSAPLWRLTVDWRRLKTATTLEEECRPCALDLDSKIPISFLSKIRNGRWKFGSVSAAVLMKRLFSPFYFHIPRGYFGWGFSYFFF